MRREYARWTVAEETKLRELHPTTSLATIAKELDRPPHAVYDKAIRMGLSKIASVPRPSLRKTPIDKKRALEVAWYGAERIAVGQKRAHGPRGVYA